MGQHARQEREQLEWPSRLPRFFPGLTPSRRQRAQIERAKAKRPLIQLDTVLEKFQHRPIANSSEASSTTNLRFDLETRMPPEFQQSCSYIREKSIVTQEVQLCQEDSTRCSLESLEVRVENSTNVQCSGNLIRPLHCVDVSVLLILLAETYISYNLFAVDGRNQNEPKVELV